MKEARVIGKNSTELTLPLREGRKGVGFHIQLLPVFHCSYGWKYIWIWNGPKGENKEWAISHSSILVILMVEIKTSVKP